MLAHAAAGPGLDPGRRANFAPRRSGGSARPEPPPRPPRRPRAPPWPRAPRSTPAAAAKLRARRPRPPARLRSEATVARRPWAGPGPAPARAPARGPPLCARLCSSPRTPRGRRAGGGGAAGGPRGPAADTPPRAPPPGPRRAERAARPAGRRRAKEGCWLGGGRAPAACGARVWEGCGAPPPDPQPPAQFGLPKGAAGNHFSGPAGFVALREPPLRDGAEAKVFHRVGHVGVNWQCIGSGLLGEPGFPPLSPFLLYFWGHILGDQERTQICQEEVGGRDTGVQDL